MCTQSDRTKPEHRDHQRGQAVWSQSELVPHPRPHCQLWPIIMVILIILITIIIKIIIRSPFLVESVTNTIPEHPDQLSWSFPLPHFPLYFGSITLFHTMCQSSQHNFIDLNISIIGVVIWGDPTQNVLLWSSSCQSGILASLLKSTIRTTEYLPSSLSWSHYLHIAQCLDAICKRESQDLSMKCGRVRKFYALRYVLKQTKPIKRLSQ